MSNNLIDNKEIKKQLKQKIKEVFDDYLEEELEDRIQSLYINYLRKSFISILTDNLGYEIKDEYIKKYLKEPTKVEIEEFTSQFYGLLKKLLKKHCDKNSYKVFNRMTFK